ncbi:LAFA_0D16930g1_1 [Lachancea sp. 'fantastica']|nr:LAFA_0D16930g1_1 [Lachancea sp. 'fantastica']
MEDVDAEFAPLRKSLQAVDANKIIQDVSVDHEQQAFLRKIRLVTGQEKSSKSQIAVEGANEGSEARTDTNSALPTPSTGDASRYLASKRPHSDHEDDVPTPKRKQANVLDPDFLQFQAYFLKQLNGSLPPTETRLPSFVHECSKEVERILKQSIIQKESHSAIIVGPRSHFKTAVIEHHLSFLTQKYEQQFVTIRLNGLIHSEQAAINSIAYQLESRLQGLHGNKDISFSISSGSLTEVFEKVLRLIDTTAIQHSKSSSASRAEKISIIFIFDEIDTFAGPLRQTLLYNLFDMVEHARVPVCILGSTTKMNVVEHLEKRVNSRFSQRMIYVPTIKTFEEFLDVVQEDFRIDITNESALKWNEALKQLINKDTSNLRRVLKNNYETFRSTILLKNSLQLLVAKEKSIEALISGLETCYWINCYNRNQLENSLSSKVKTLSDLELAVLVAAARVSLKTDDNVNFNLAYAEYSSMVKETNKKMPIIPQATGTSMMLESTLRVWKKQDVKNIWENIIDLDFLAERGSVGLRVSASAAFQASNYHATATIIPFDLRTYQMQITLQELRRTVPKLSIYYSWTQL